MMKRALTYMVFMGVFAGIMSCKDDTPDPHPTEKDLTTIPFNPISYTIDAPDYFPILEIPADNPMTEEGIALGRHLFYDPILSIDNTVSCASCHLATANFSDPDQFSKGVDGALGKRNAMSLLNVAFFKRGLFWDGRAQSLEEQALVPVEDPAEMKNTWEEVVSRLSKHEDYPFMFRKAFGIERSSEITKEMAAKALAQFERIIVSKGTSKWDRVQMGLDVFTDEELLGKDLFFDENEEVPDAECSHCHGIPLGTSDEFFNNGINFTEDLMGFDDLGKGKVTGIISDNGKFRAPGLRNIRFSAPYMHDGRFNNLDEVIEHYNSGGKNSPNKDPLIRPLNLDENYKSALKAFILALEEPDILTREALTSPFQ